MNTRTRPYPLYIDENIPQRTAQALSELGYDVLTLKEDGKANQGYPDESVLRDAASLCRVVVTHDRKDFRRLHSKGEISHRGIVLCTQGHDPVRLAQRIDAELSNKEAMDGEVVYVNRPSAGVPRTTPDGPPAR